MRQPSVTGAILSTVNVASFFLPRALYGTREIDQISDHDPYYDREDYALRQSSVYRGEGYKADLTFTPNRGLIAYKDDNSRYMLFQFNPDEIVDDKSVIYEDREKTGLDNTDFLWIRGGTRTLEFSLFLDATEGSRQSHLGRTGAKEIAEAERFTHDPDRGVLNQVEFLTALLRPQRPDPNVPVFVRGSVGAFNQFTPPPEIVFVYGPFYFEGVIVRANPTYTLWSRSLVPLRATVNVVIRVQEGQALKINKALTDISSRGFNINQ